MLVDPATYVLWVQTLSKMSQAGRVLRTLRRLLTVIVAGTKRTVDIASQRRSRYLVSSKGAFIHQALNVL